MPASFIGLTSSEVKSRQQVYGKNVLKGKHKSHWFILFFNQFRSLLIVVLLIATIVSLLLHETTNAIFILLIIFINASLGFFQEYKAENTLETLRDLTIASIKVIRNGVFEEIPSTDLVPGDYIAVSEGDKITADGVVRESHNFEVNEASISGESLPISKNAHGLVESIVYSGTIVTKGKAIIEITHIGSETRIGSMASELSELSDTETPLTKKVNYLARQLSILAASIILLIFIVGIFQHRSMISMLVLSISLAVAAVPEGLPSVITIALAVGLQRMAKKRAILRKLDAIEALGNTTVIVTDKTGTLTENRMSVVKIWFDDKLRESDKLSKDEQSSKTFTTLLYSGVLNNNASLSSSNSNTSVIGDSTDGSILLYANSLMPHVMVIRSKGEILNEFQFDTLSKRMSIVWKDEKSLSVYTKGAPETILMQSTRFMKQGHLCALTPQTRKEAISAYQSMARQGLRVIGFAYKNSKTVPLHKKEAENNLILLGFVGIADPPRKEIHNVIATARRAGITTIMVTGDNPLTASYIATKTGIIEEGSCVVTGEQLERMTDEQLKKQIMLIRVFARVTPDDKLRIVQALQSIGQIVAVTGDGVNDALALKKADVGVAMGITGTDVAKEVADMVITDDNYISIVEAIKQGRIIFDNIVKSVTYLISSNLGELLTITIAVLFGFPSPLLPVHILWINLVTDGLPALSLAMDPADPHVMSKKAQYLQHSLVSSKQYKTIVEISAFIAGCTLISFIATYQIYSLEVARTISFTTIIFIQLIMVFFIRKGQSPFSNKYLLVTVVVTILLQMVALFLSPFSSIFEISFPWTY